MSLIRFDRHPVWVTVGEGLRIAARYWRASVVHWVLPVAAIVLVNILAELLLGGSSFTSEQMRKVITSGPLGPGVDTAQLPRLLAGPLAVGIVSIAAQWFLVANAIAGLRGKEVSTAWVLASGLRSFVADMLAAMVLVLIVTVGLMFGVIGVLALILLVPALFYVALRLQFWTLAIFDGLSITAAFDRSWTITRGGVMRVLGWGLVVFLVGLVPALFVLALDLLLPGAPLVTLVIASLIDTVLLAYTTIVLAVLYESQRLRQEPAPAAGYANWPGTPGWPGDLPVPPVPPAEPRGPYDPPPPPAPPSWPGA